MKLTVKEYATSLNISVQAVYKKIKLGSIETVKENNTTYVIVDSSEFKEVVKPIENQSCNELLNLIEHFKSELKASRKEIKRLTKQNEKQHSFLISKYENALPKPKKDEDVVDVSPVKKKSKKDKNKKGKK